MDSLQGSSLQVVLKIKKGKGFDAVATPVVFVATLDGIKLETKKILPREISSFNGQLTWEGDKNYLRRLRKINTALKIELLTDSNEQKRDKLGYVCINLKQAQILTASDMKSEIQTWYNLLGISRQLKVFKPQILLVFKIQEATAIPECTNNVSSCVKLNTLEPKMDEVRKSNYLQIGPPNLCSKFYELSIDISETGNLCSIILPNEIGSPVKIQFHIMGLSLETKEFYGFKGILNREKFKVQIKSEIQFLAAYFKQFPSLTFYVLCAEKPVGSGSMKLQELTDLREHFTASAKEKIILKSTDGKDSHITDCLNPYIKVDITLVPMLESAVISASQNSVPLNKIVDIIVPDIPVNGYTNDDNIIPINDEMNKVNQEKECLDICEELKLKPTTSVENEINPNDNLLPLPKPVESSTENPSDFAIPHLNLEEGEMEIQKEDVTPKQFESPQKVILPQIVGSKNTTIKLFQHCQTSQTEPLTTSADILPKEYVQELATKYIEELEDWKEKQQEKFKFELKRKTDKHLTKLAVEWTKRQHILEVQLTTRLETCHSLKIRLEEILQELQQKLEYLNKCEQELLHGKCELDKRYTVKFRELRKASKQHEKDMEEKIKRADLEKCEFRSKIYELEEEISKLKKQLLIESESRLTVEESKKLLVEKETLEEKLQKAIESRNYFKEQCTLILREVYKLRTEKEDQDRWKIRKDKDGLEIISLVEEINNEVDEMRKDQSTLSALRSEIKKYGSS